MKTREIELDGVPICVTGIAKGAAMIGPNLATMLALVLTDAKLSQADALAGLKDAADESFNCISVDGHTSTNDTVLFLANGAAGGPELTGRFTRQISGHAGGGLRGPGPIDPSRRRGGHAFDYRGSPRKSTRVKKRCRVAKTIADSPARENGDRRVRSQLGADRFGGRLFGRSFRSGESEFAGERHACSMSTAFR